MEPEKKQPVRVIGVAKGEIPLTDAFFEPLPEDMLRAFEGDGADCETREVRSVL